MAIVLKEDQTEALLKKLDRWYSKKETKGLVHHIWPKDTRPSFDDDLTEKQKALILKEWAILENEALEFAQGKAEEFLDYLENKGFDSSMGTIGKKR